MEKGQTNNPAGRPLGMPNKLTADLRAKLQSIIDNNIDRVQNDLDNLEAKDRLQVLEKLLSYVLPKPTEKVNEEETNVKSALYNKFFNRTEGE